MKFCIYIICRQCHLFEDKKKSNNKYQNSISVIHHCTQCNCENCTKSILHILDSSPFLTCTQTTCLIDWLFENLGLCSVLRAFEQGGIFIVPHLLWHEALVFPVSTERLSHSVASYDTQWDVENLFSLGSSQIPIQSPLTTHKGRLRTFSYPYAHGSQNVWWSIC
jgi:hypothetical protein